MSWLGAGAFVVSRRVDGMRVDVTSGPLFAFVGVSVPGFCSMLPISKDEARNRPTG